MFAARCEYGVDNGNRDRKGEITGQGLSYLAFDFAREVLVIKSRLNFGGGMQEASIPPALRPLDAELSFEDISAEGVNFTQREMAPDSQWYLVTVTINCRRPPRFYVAFQASENMFSNAEQRRIPPRRRATVMDFANTPVVSLMPILMVIADGTL